MRNRPANIFRGLKSGGLIKSQNEGMSYSTRRNAKLFLVLPILLWSQILVSQSAPKVFFTASFDEEVPTESKRLGGTWEVLENHVRQRELKGQALLVLANPEWNRPYTARVRVRFPVVRDPNGAEIGLALHIRDSRNFVIFSLQRRHGGAFAVLRAEANPGLELVGDQAQVSINPGEWHELKADVYGPHVVCYLDGKPVANWSFLGLPPPSHYSDSKLWPQDPSYGQVGLLTTNSDGDFADLELSRQPDYSHMVTPHLPKRDAEGRLLPMRSYAETMHAFARWILSSDKVVDRSEAAASLRKLKPYVLSNWVTPDDKSAGLEIGEFAINHGMLLANEVRYYAFSGDARALDMAREVADWHLANSTPADYAAPFLPPSFVAWQKDGTWKGQEWGLEPDKAAYMGIGLLKLSAVTGEQKYKDAALRIAATLRKLQQPDGSWPFRIDPKTGEIRSHYTENALWYVKFFEMVADVTANKSYRSARDRAFHWLMENPVKTNRWLGMYGDVISGVETYDQWIPLETALYLIDHRQENPDYMKVALGILEWINRIMIVNPGFHGGVPGLVEQSMTHWVDSFLELRLSEVYARLWEVTKDPSYRDLALQIANSVTYLAMSDGKMRLGLYSTARSIPSEPIIDDQFCDIMASLPETAPRDENHLLRASALLGSIAYGENHVKYSTVGRSQDILVVKGEPSAITVGGRPLKRVQRGAVKNEGWSYDAATGELRIHHQLAEVEIRF